MFSSTVTFTVSRAIWLSASIFGGRVNGCEKSPVVSASVRRECSLHVNLYGAVRIWVQEVTIKAQPTMKSILELRGVSKDFGSFRAVSDVTLQVQAGRILRAARSFWMRQDHILRMHCRL